MKSAYAVFKDNFLQPVDRRIGLQAFSRERIAVGVSDVAAITVRRHEGIVQNEFFAIVAARQTHDAGLDVVADDAVINLRCFKKGDFGDGVYGHANR